MWRRSFIATSVALGSNVDETVDMISHDGAEAESTIVEALRSPTRSVRAAALTKSVHEVIVAIDQVTLR